MKQKLIFALCGAMIGSMITGTALNKAATKEIEAIYAEAEARYEGYEARILAYRTMAIAAIGTYPDVYTYNIPLSVGMQAYTYSMCERYGIPEYYELILSVMEQESNFDANCISSTNDYGLMQINECNHEWLSEELGIVDFLDPYESIHAGVYILSGYLKKYDTPTQALMVYNMGAAGARRAWEEGRTSTPYTETILERYSAYLKYN